MYRILVVEDTPFTLQQLAKLLAEELPESEIVTAEAVQEAIKFVHEARRADKPFRAAVLDVKLPQDKNGNSELNHTIEDELSLTPGTLIIRYTAHGDEPDVREYMKDCARRTLPRVLPLSKLDYANNRRLIVEIKRDRVARQLSELYGREAGGQVETRRSATLALASLVRDISLFWSDLDEKDRRPIRKYFDVEEKADTGLIVRPGGQADA